MFQLTVTVGFTAFAVAVRVIPADVSRQKKRKIKINAAGNFFMEVFRNMTVKLGQRIKQRS